MKPTLPPLDGPFSPNTPLDNPHHATTNSQTSPHHENSSMDVEIEDGPRQEYQLLAIPLSPPYVPTVPSAIPDVDTSYASFFAGAYTQEHIIDDCSLIIDLPELYDPFSFEATLPDSHSAATDPTTVDNSAFIAALLSPMASDTLNSESADSIQGAPSNGAAHDQPVVPIEFVLAPHDLHDLMDIPSQSDDILVGLDHWPSTLYASFPSSGQYSLSPTPLTLTYGVDAFEPAMSEGSQDGQMVPNGQPLQEFLFDDTPSLSANTNCHSVSPSNIWQPESNFTSDDDALPSSRKSGQNGLSGSTALNHRLSLVLALPPVEEGSETARAMIHAIDRALTHLPWVPNLAEAPIKENGSSSQQDGRPNRPVIDTLRARGRINRQNSDDSTAGEASFQDDQYLPSSLSENSLMSSDDEPFDHQVLHDKPIEASLSGRRPSKAKAKSNQAKKTKNMQSRNSFMLFRSLVSFIYSSARAQGKPALRQTELSSTLGKLWVKHHPHNPRYPKNRPNHSPSGCADCAVKKLFAAASLNLASRDSAIFDSTHSSSPSSATAELATDEPNGSSSTQESRCRLKPVDAMDWAQLERFYHDSKLLRQVLTAMKTLKGYSSKASPRQVTAMLKKLWIKHEQDHESNRRDDIRIKTQVPKTMKELLALLAESIATN